MYIADKVDMEAPKQKAFSNYNPQAFGGTEYMARGFVEKISDFVPKFDDYRSMVFPGLSLPYSQLKDGTPTIVWLHNLIDQFGPEPQALFTDPAFVDNIKYLITVSEFAKQKVIEQMPISPEKVIVIQNAVDPIAYNKNKFKNVKKPIIMHCSSPDRGMEMLLLATTQIEEDFELQIFNNFDPNTVQATGVWNKIINDKRISFYNKTPRNTVVKHWVEAHIHAYPSIYDETSCITQIEALAANTLSVYSNYSVLPETSMGYGIPVDLDKNNINQFITDYAKALTDAIKMIKAGEFKPGNQAKTVADAYSWEKTKERFIALHELL
jgi:glycosyltransferase involved in cell wall biosynthesis